MMATHILLVWYVVALVDLGSLENSPGGTINLLKPGEGEVSMVHKAHQRKV